MKNMKIINGDKNQLLGEIIIISFRYSMNHQLFIWVFKHYQLQD